MAKKISAKDLVNDIRSGMDDDGLMRKYEISDQGLQRLLGQLLEKGLITESDLSSRPPKATEVVVDTSLQETSEPASRQVRPERSKSEDITFQNLFGDWYESKKALILLLIFCTPIGLYGLHRTSLWPKKTKIAIAVLTVVLAIAAIKPALRLWVMGVVGIGAYGLYKILPFGRAARIAIAIVAGMLVVGMIAPFIDTDSERRKAVSAQTTETTRPEPQPVQPKPVPVVQPVPPQPVQVAKPAAQPKSEPKQKPTASGKPVSEITWSDVQNKFIKLDPDLTSAQREKLEKDRKQWWQESYRGKWVRWRGSVNNVSSGGSKVKIDMGEGSWGSDIVLIVTPDSKEKAAGLNKDSYVTFVGRISEQPGGLIAMELQEATIE